MPARKGKKTKRGGTPKKKGRTSSLYLIPDWIHWLVTAVFILLIAFGAYTFLLKPYFYRWLPCQGYKEYDVCVPTGFRYYGIDVSHHQGQIDWPKVALSAAGSDCPVKFVIIKATEGGTFLDPDFETNLKGARDVGFVCGVYHFYNPDTPAGKQAEFFISNVKLNKGDFAPVVDVERTGRSDKELQEGLAEFLSILEKHYGAKPVIYSSAKFRKRHLDSARFNYYPAWIAHYYVVRPDSDVKWRIWQFTDRGRVDGISEYTDLNVFSGTEADFNSLRLK